MPKLKPGPHLGHTGRGSRHPSRHRRRPGQPGVRPGVLGHCQTHLGTPPRDGLVAPKAMSGSSKPKPRRLTE